MKQEDLLLMDLCSRLYYKVKVSLIYNNEEYKGVLCAIYPEDNRVIIDNLNKPCHYYNQTCGGFLIGENKVKPYLFPLSSMTAEQKREYHQSTSKDIDMLQDVILERINGKDNTNKHAIAYNGIDWLNAHHFDYRGLIEKGLAIDATGLNVYN